VHLLQLLHLVHVDEMLLRHELLKGTAVLCGGGGECEERVRHEQ
jgi:hypothetical protein